MNIDNFRSYFKLKFKDRAAAAISLSRVLNKSIRNPERKGTLVFAIPKGGVVTADIVCNKLSISNFEILLPRKLQDPDNKEQAIGAVIDGGFTYILNDIVKKSMIGESYINSEISHQFENANRTKTIYAHICNMDDSCQKIRICNTILLLDDGVATGATMMVTIKWLNKIIKDQGLGPKRIIAAAPIIPEVIAGRMSQERNTEVVTIFAPSANTFQSVEQYYQRFSQVDEETVLEILKNRNASNLT